MCNWYRKFIEHYADIAEPLVRLTRKKVDYVWDEDCQLAFERLKTMLISSPILSRPEFDREFILETDASDTGLGAVLKQSYEDGDRVIAYASRVLSAAERNYSVTERECLAILWAVRKFRCYVEAEHFSIITGHYCLKWLVNLQNPSGRLADGHSNLCSMILQSSIERVKTMKFRTHCHACMKKLRLLK